MAFITTTDEHIASGGTITGNLTIDADLTVSGSTAITTNEVIQGTSIIDVTNTEALLIRKNGDGGDLLVADTTNMRVGIGIAPSMALSIAANNGSPATSGTTQVGNLRLEDVSGGNANVLDMGTFDSSPWGAWLQVTNRSDLNEEYPLVLQPNGGDVGIGGTPNGEANLLVHSGDANASSIYITNTDTGIGDTSGLVVGIENDEGGKINKFGSGSFLRLGTNGVHRMILDDNSRISLSNNDGNTGNTVFGKSAFLNANTTDNDYNTIFGELAMGTGTPNSAANNTSIGYKSLEDITSAHENTSVGHQNMSSITTGQYNTSIGSSALTTALTAAENVSIGYRSMC
jgi:hypothetical protein